MNDSNCGSIVSIGHNDWTSTDCAFQCGQLRLGLLRVVSLDLFWVWELHSCTSLFRIIFYIPPDNSKPSLKALNGSVTCSLLQQKEKHSLNWLQPFTPSRYKTWAIHVSVCVVWYECGRVNSWMCKIHFGAVAGCCRAEDCYSLVPRENANASTSFLLEYIMPQPAGLCCPWEGHYPLQEMTHSFSLHCFIVPATNTTAITVTEIKYIIPAVSLNTFIDLFSVYS